MIVLSAPGEHKSGKQDKSSLDELISNLAIRSRKKQLKLYTPLSFAFSGRSNFHFEFHLGEGAQ